MIPGERPKENTSCSQTSAYQAGAFREVALPARPINEARCATTLLLLAYPPKTPLICSDQCVDVASRHVRIGSSRPASVSDRSPHRSLFIAGRKVESSGLFK